MYFTDKIILSGLIIGALYFDIKEQRIPNVLILGGLIGGIISIVMMWPESAILNRCGALLVGIGLLLIPFIAGGMGAGDVKLLGTIGFLTGMQSVINIALLSFLTGGIIALTVIIQQRIQKYKNTGSVMASFLNFFFTKKLITAEEGALPIPFAIPLGIGTFFVVVLRWCIV